MPYEYLEDIAIADIAFRADSPTLEALFRTAGDALMNVMVEDLDAILFEETREVSLEDQELDLLLFDFLQEYIYYKDSEQLLLRATDVYIENKNNKKHLRATLQGEILDPERHIQGVDVKAVTLHNFHLEKTPTGWTATVILDI